ncbi:1-deoxy-D-xylulose-5-phosphate synthase N-terminal domain-containing protein [Histidinibacterium aquaticum]|uniref:Transketolase n=1 Tax=Histidinibacterium aquaticum TaxID=2613962 RepID=A0A5J5GCK5_9RHOB|nr:1-deoxy-D-xylulose-5-phosphate synthase N-terminal domain-containing protein [Histidinibacterium aquaticum]KAA9005727.1 transketolase [Histidinibacterium aquaticum]
MIPNTDLGGLADRLRLRAAKMIAPHGFGYLGQVLSSAELFAALYGRHYRPGQDAIVVSPGHYIIAAYAAAAEIGVLDEKLLETYGFDDSDLEAIGTERSPAVDLTGGSLSQGLSGAVGFALSDKMAGKDDVLTFALCSDGELEEGQLWEAALFAGHNKLRNLVVLLDANDSQVDGPVSEITTIEPIAAKWESFGWDAYDVDGHDAAAVDEALGKAIASDKPAVVIGRTSTVHGLKALPEGADGHFIKLPRELADAAIAELEARVA